MQGSHVICLSSLKNSAMSQGDDVTVFLHDHIRLAGDTDCGSSSWGFFSFSLLIMNPGKFFKKKALLPPFHVSVCSFFKDLLSYDLQ